MNTIGIYRNHDAPDTFGRFCLNDLHKASGGAKKDQPANFTSKQVAQDLVEELYSLDSRITPIVTQRGINGGTYVVKELVYAATLVAACAAIRYVDQP